MTESPPATEGRRRVVALGVVVAVLVAAAGYGLLALAGVVGSSDSSPARSAIRHRVDLMEADPFVLVLLGVHHSAQTTIESLTCQPVGSSYLPWNFRVITAGVTDQGALDRVVARADEFGWSTATGADGSVAFTRTIAPGLPVKLYIVRSGHTVELDTNVSLGLPCQ